jgi:hypothetical protein
MQAKNIVRDDLLVGSDIGIDTPQWLEWLFSNTAFRYQSKDTQFNCLKRFEVPEKSLRGIRPFPACCE